MRRNRTVALAAALCAAGLVAAGCGSSSGSTGTGGRRQAADHQRCHRRELELPVQPAQHELAGRRPHRDGAHLRASDVREPAPDGNPAHQGNPPVAGDELQLELQSDRAHLHHPQGRQVQRRHAADACGRRLLVQHHEGERRAGPVVAVEGRRRAAHERDHLGRHCDPELRRAVADVLLLRSRPGAHPPGAHLVEDPGLQAADLPGQPPGRHGCVRGRELQFHEPHLQGKPALLAARQARCQDGGVAGLPEQHHRQQLPDQRPVPVGRPVHPQHQPDLHRQGSRRLPQLGPVSEFSDPRHQPGAEEQPAGQRQGPAGDGAGDQPEPGRRHR